MVDQTVRGSGLFTEELMPFPLNNTFIPRVDVRGVPIIRN